MRSGLFLVLVVCSPLPLFSQDVSQGPANPKAQKSYQQGLEQLQQRADRVALWYFRQADKQDQGHCVPCHGQLVQVGLKVRDWKAVEEGASRLASEVTQPKQQAVAHHYLGMALLNEGMDAHQDSLIGQAHDEFSKAIALDPSIPDILWEDGKALAQLHKDEEARAQFQKFAAMTPPGQPERRRALQFTTKPELARANLAPEFVVFTAEGHAITLGDLAGKAVLVYFWSTMCDTCAHAFPRLREIAKKFEDQPFVLLSISVDYDAAAWRSFLESNDVPGIQYRDGYNGPVAQGFGVGVQLQSNVDNPIAGVWQTSHRMKQDVPRTFTIDAGGVLEPEKVSDSLDARLQELVTRANADRVRREKLAEPHDK